MYLVHSFFEVWGSAYTHEKCLHEELVQAHLVCAKQNSGVLPAETKNLNFLIINFFKKPCSKVVANLISKKEAAIDSSPRSVAEHTSRLPNCVVQSGTHTEF